MRKLIIKVAPTSVSENVKNNPLTPRAIADETYKCFLAGASIVHIHRRDFDGKPTMSDDALLETIKLIGKKCDILIDLSEKSDLTAFNDLSNKSLVQSIPINSGSVSLFNEVISCSLPDIRTKLKLLSASKGLIEMCSFDISAVNNALSFVDEGIVKNKLYFGLYLGYPGGAPTSCLEYIVSMIPKQYSWFVAEFNKNNNFIAAKTIAMGGHIRVGFEDSNYNCHNEFAVDNAELVIEIANLARAIGREVATVDETIKILRGFDDRN